MEKISTAFERNKVSNMTTTISKTDMTPHLRHEVVVYKKELNAFTSFFLQKNGRILSENLPVTL
jgi:hypothetical protein